MSHIPSNDIKQPQMHADKLGFTFVWKGHFLRGIYPSAVEQAKSYFDSGFIDEVTEKGLFPKTWISEYENEQFGMIIEHEMITPILYATEWNSAMLKDATLMVLDIAEIGWKHGYNMVDCHKLNVLFQNNRPVYVDLGSFIPKKKGSTGWMPYTSFLRSYYYILKMWTEGMPTLAKRMMAPGLEMPESEYYAFKNVVYRLLPALYTVKASVRKGLCRLAVLGDDEISKRGKAITYFKTLVNFIKPSASQHFSKLKRKVMNIKLKSINKTLPKDNDLKINALTEIIKSQFPDVGGITFIDNNKTGYYESLLEKTRINQFISLQQDDFTSCQEYYHSKPEWKFTSVSLRMINNSVLLRNKFPENRLRSDIAVVPNLSLRRGMFGVHNTKVFIEHCLLYANSALIVGVKKNIQELKDAFKNKYHVENISLKDVDIEGYLIVYSSK